MEECCFCHPGIGTTYRVHHRHDYWCVAIRYVTLLTADSVLGGLLAQSEATWRTIYWMQAGLAGALTVVGFFVLPADTHENRYNQGLDLVGAALSTAGIGLLVYDLAYVFQPLTTDLLLTYCSRESTVTPRGWATPFVPSLLGTAVILIVSFVVWEIRREAKGQSVLFPMSLWKQPKAMMGPIVLIVFFGWWAFNTLGYFVPLYFQQVLLLSPLQTSVRLIPMGLTVRIPLHPITCSLTHYPGSHHELGYWVPDWRRTRANPGRPWPSISHGKETTN